MSRQPDSTAGAGYSGKPLSAKLGLRPGSRILPLGLVDVKVCSVDEVWSGLKLVIRVANRPR